MAPNGNPPLTEAQQLFLERFPDLEPDDPLVALQSWNAALEKKVDDFSNRLDLWTNAILTQTNLAAEQTGLITSQNLTLQQTTQSYARFGEILTGLQQDFRILQQEYKLLKDTISAQSSTLTRLSNQLGLEASLEDPTQTLAARLKDFDQKLKSLETIKTLTEKVDTLTRTVEPLPARLSSVTTNLNAEIDRNSWRQAFAAGGGLVFFALLLAQVYVQKLNYDQMRQDLDQVNRNVNQVLIEVKPK